MAERTPNGPADLLDETPPAPSEESAAVAYTIDDEDPAPPSDPSAAVSVEARGQDPGGIGEREPSLISRLSAGAAAEGGEGTLHRKGSSGWHGKESALAEKTSKIMSDYQAYLAEIETEFPTAADGDEVEAERSIAEKRALQVHRYRDHPEGTFPPDQDAEYGVPVGGLYRGWSYDGENRSGIHIDRGVADFEEHPHPMMSVRRGTSSRGNKRIRRGLAMLVLVSLIIGVSLGISKKRKKMSLPDWDAQLAEAESKSQEHGDGGDEQHPQMGHDDSQVNEQLSMMYENVSERFHPVFFDRTNGWKGQTYVEALEFCQEKNQYKELEMRICPYMAICPGGQSSRPLGGYKSENGEQDLVSYRGTWVPVIDGANEWVSVGNDNSCVKWSALNDGGTPDWGSSGEGNEANTRHLVCCDADAVEVAEEELMLQQKAKEEENKATEIAMSQDAGMYTSGLPQAGVAPTEASSAQPSQQAEENPELPYKISATKFQPVYFSRNDGWQGTTYRDAVQFCSDIENIHMICPFEAVCPAGLGETPMGSFANEDEPEMLWVPLSDEANSWVSVGKDQPCLPFKNQPNFGPDDVVSKAWTQNIACCLITDDTQNFITSLADLNEASTTTPATTAAEAIIEAAAQEGAVHSEEIDKAYEAMAVMFEPLTFDRDSGWKGQTYLEAMGFCADKSDASGERSICPLAAICPLGRGENPSFGPKDEPNGSWAPISDDPNAWVQVSTDNTCLTYQDVNNANPQWGYSGEDNEEITRHIYCCLTKLATDSAEVSAVVASEPTNEPTPEPTNEPTPEPTNEPTPEPTNEPTPEPTNEPTPEPTPEPTNEPTPEPTPPPSSVLVESSSPDLSAVETQALYQAAEQKYQPLIFDGNSDPSWTGRAYLQALQFCASQDSRVPCPYTALCPAGPGSSPFGGIKNGFSPVINQPNSWVSVGPEGTCQTYSDLYGSPPEWGLTGEGDPSYSQVIICCNDIEDDMSDSSSEEESSAQSIVLTDTEQAVLDSFKPQWFGRDAGYQGTTYDDALEFCGNVAGMVLCPLMAYCPNGPQASQPLFLQLEPFEGEQWAPVAVEGGGTGANYIMVGTMSNNPTTTCLSYDDLKGVQAPSWGLDGTDTEIKQHILCCNDPSFSSDGVITPAVEEDLNSVPTQTEDSPTLADGSFDLEGAVTLELAPVWLDEEDGWTGGSHDDAEAFCNKLVNKSLCPYAAYCPHGPGQPVIGGHDVDFVTEGVQWAPVFGSNNHWVLLSQKSGNSATTCMTHADLEGSPPDWGLTEARPWLKRHIMCCNLKNGF